jgi:hypothetical protein
MKATPKVRVTLSDELLRHLRRHASDLKVPFEWFVVGLVCDTVESLTQAQRPAPAVVLLTSS